MTQNHPDMSGMKHLLLMLACCVIPIAGLLAIGVFGLSLGWINSLIPYAMVLFCPIMMIFMMRGMMGGQNGHDVHHQGLKQNPVPRLGARTVLETAPAESDPPRCH